MDALSPIVEAPHAGGWLATLGLGLARRHDRTVLARRRHVGPLTVQKPLYPEPDAAICHLTLLHPPGGLASGDTLRLDIELDADAHAVITTPGATKWYKAHPAHPSRQELTIRVADGARLDWLPLENIYFDHSQAHQRMDVSVGAGASALGWDAALLGRQASGETWSAGQVRNDFRLLDGAGRLLWTERQRLTARAALRAAPQGLAGMPAYGTLWAVGGACDATLAEALAPDLPFDSGLRAGATSPMPGVLLVRAVATHIEPLRHLFAALWLRLRPLVHGVPGRPLRLWAT
ncbi:urease accessory protein [Bordetella genomosp. 9]|uniref:Urease accessory protein UreD n=1 Tax=Bordetella genomosp. 9 TaxID=1416803 RepID=A0A261R4I2_9BORD|nr:urease accessory protein UreD [Bordetella genomosp. 9]OZI19530.1 urease accessory protein [Bordetella genomosp. 9]